MKKYRPVPTAAAYTAEYRDFVEATGGGAGVTITLPSVTNRRGDPLVIQKVDAGAGAVTIAPQGASTINGGATLVLTGQWDSVYLITDGTNWFSVAGAGGSGAGVTLQDAYDNGPTIVTTAANGAVALSQGAALTGSVLTVTDASAGVALAPMVSLLNSGARTGQAILSISSTSNVFTGFASLIQLGGNHATGRGWQCADVGTGARTTILAEVINANNARTSGDLLVLTNAGSAFTGYALNIALSGISTAQKAVRVVDGGTGANTTSLITIDNANVARATGDLVTITSSPDAFIGSALNVGLTGASVAQVAITVADGGTGANTSSLVLVTSTNDARTSGNLVEISNSGDALTGACLFIENTVLSASQSRQGLVVVDNGTATSFGANWCEITNAGGRAAGQILLIANTGAAYASNMVRIATGSATTTEQALEVSDSGSGAVTTALVTFSNDNANRTSGGLLAIVNAQNAFTGDALNIVLSGASTAQRGVFVVDNGSGANTANFITFGSNNVARTSGAVCSIFGGGAAFTGDVFSVQLNGSGAASATQKAVRISETNGLTPNTTPLVTISSAHDLRAAITAPLLNMVLTASSEATVPYLTLGGMNIFCDTGAPNNANGNNGDLYIQRDGVAAAKIYSKDAGTWTAI